MRELCIDFLKTQGYRPDVDGNGNVVFKVEGKVYIIDIDKRDGSFLRVLLPNFYEIETELEMSKALRVSNKINQSVKVGKIFIASNNHAWGLAEQFIDDTPNLEDFFQRTLNVIRKASEDFTKEMLEGLV